MKKHNPFLLYLYHVWVIIELEVTKMMKDPIEVLSRSLQPVIWLLLFGGAFSRLKIVPEVGDYQAFLTPGILAQAITFVSIFNGLAIIWERDMGLLQKILTTPIERSALVLGKMLAATVKSLSQLAVVLVVTWLLGIHLEWGWGRALGLLVFVVLGSAFFSGFSMVVAALVKTRDRMMGIGQLVTMPLFFASSALYPVSIMPPWLQAAARANPLSYLVDGLRGFLLEPAYGQWLLDGGVLLGASLFIWALATREYPNLLT
ncbi:MAG TPA: ABC transporter permease [bacterium]|nr:ABC transporter permease [bacterium]